MLIYNKYIINYLIHIQLGLGRLSKGTIWDQFRISSIAGTIASFHFIFIQSWRFPTSHCSIFCSHIEVYSPFYWSSTHFVQTSGVYLINILTHFIWTLGTCLLIVEVQPRMFIISLPPLREAFLQHISGVCSYLLHSAAMDCDQALCNKLLIKKIGMVKITLNLHTNKHVIDEVLVVPNYQWCVFSLYLLSMQIWLWHSLFFLKFLINWNNRLSHSCWIIVIQNYVTHLVMHFIYFHSLIMQREMIRHSNKKFIHHLLKWIATDILSIIFPLHIFLHPGR